MQEIFEKEGIALEGGGNHPMTLDDPESAYLVQSGKMDIFAVPTSSSMGTRTRTHLLRVGKGHVLFGVDCNAPGVGMELVGVGVPGTKLRRLELSRLQQLAIEPALSRSIKMLVERWLTTLLAVPLGRLIPKDTRVLEPGKEIVVNQGQKVVSRKGWLWVKHLDGDSRLLGRDDIPLVSGAFSVPISEQIWLQVTAGSTLECLDTEQYFKSNPSWSDFKAFHRLFLDAVASDLATAENYERERLQTRVERDRLGKETALSQLTSLLGHKKAALAALTGKADPLLLACEIVGGASGIGFRPSRQDRSGPEQLEALTDIARASGVRMRRMVLEDDWWSQDSGPLLAYRKQDKRPVALVPDSPRSYQMHDPVERTKIRVTRNNADSLEQFAYMFYRPFPERAISARELVTFGLRGCLRDTAMIAMMGIVGALLGLLTPVAVGIVLDTVIPEAARGRLVQIVLILLTCAVAASMFDITKRIALLRVEGKMDIALQAALWDRLLSLPTAFFRNFIAGDLASRSLGINFISQILSGVTVTAILTGLFSSLNFALLFYYDSQLALVAAVLSVAGIACVGGVSYLKVRCQRSMSEINGKISGMILQFITAIAKLRVAGAEGRAFAVWAAQFKRQREYAYKAGIVESVLQTFNATFPVVALMAIFAWVVLKGQGRLSTGHFVAFIAAFVGFQNALLQMAASLTVSLNIIPLYERLAPIIRALPETDSSKAHPGQLTGEIEVNHLKFRYIPDGPIVLNDVSFTVKAGEFVAIVGESGSGKSTLLRLLLGFETPEMGTIYYNGQDLAYVDVREVRRQIGVVLQDAKVMPGDIFNNIVGASNLTMDDAWEAARMVGLSEDIEQMPMGMNTIVSVGGDTFSGGQRQRLLIARAVVRKPNILFFDEATSALDNKTQAVVSKSLEALLTTRVVIAHRLSTIINADRILVLEGGKIVQSGSYNDLMEQEGPFAKLAKRQIS